MKKISQYFTRVFVLIALIYSQFLPVGNLLIEGEEASTIKYNVSILTEAKTADGADKLAYRTDEAINPRAMFDISGTTAKIENAKTLITIPKVKHNGQLILTTPNRVVLDSAQSNNLGESGSRFYEDEDNWYAEYSFSTLVGGSIAFAPFPFRFLPGVTPNGATVTPTYQLFDGEGRLLDRAEVTYTAIVPEWEPYKEVITNWQYRETIENKIVYVNNADYWDKDVETSTGAGGRTIGYRLRFSVPHSGNYYTPESVRVVDHLPPGAEVHPNSLAEGWVYDPATHTATYTGQLGVAWRQHMYKDIQLIFRNIPAVDTTLTPLRNQIQNGIDPSYIRTNTAEFYVTRLGEEIAIGEQSAHVLFTSTGRTTPTFGRTAHKWFDMWGTMENFGEGWANTFNIETGLISANPNTFRTIHFNSRITQTNNGSARNNPEGGITASVQRIEYYNIDDRLTPHSLRVGGATNDRAAAALDATTIRAIGITANGDRQELGILKRNKRLFLPKSMPVFSEIHFVFDQPVTLDRSEFGINLEMNPTVEELEKYRAGEYTGRQRYEMRMRVNWKNSTQEDYETSNQEEHFHNNYSLVRFPEPKAQMGADGNHYLVYGYNNVRNQTVWAGAHSVGGTSWEGLPSEFKRRKWKTISLLPSGIEFVKVNRQYDQLGLTGTPAVQPQIVPNFNNTGKTAVIFEFETTAELAGHPWDGAIEFGVNVTRLTKPGSNIIEHFTVWEDNDRVPPAFDSYTDALDLDSDGNKTEKFMRKTTEITFIPPEEIISKKLVGLVVTGDMGETAPAQDIGGDVFYRLSLLNNTPIDLGDFSIVDVFPYVGDHTIVENQSGDYLPRNSQFETPLFKALEDVTDLKGNKVNAKVLERFDVFYSLTPQGADLASVREAQWLTKEDIETLHGGDFTKVKNIKMVIKEGQKIKAKEEIYFYTHHKIPVDKNLPIFSIARNSMAISRNTVDYIEANAVTVTNVKYSQDGTVFLDVNQDGNKQEDELGLAGYDVQLMNEDGTPAIDVDGSEMKTQTNQNGQYRFDVYKRGRYYVKVTKKRAEDQFTIRHSEVGTTGNDTAQDETEPFDGRSEVFHLEPSSEKTRHATRNAGIIFSAGSITVDKEDEAGNKVSDVFFSLRQNGREVGSGITDLQGRLLFPEHSFGNYELVEMEAPDQYKLGTETRIIELSLAQPNQTISIVNYFKRGNVVVKKVDSVDKDKVLSGVEFALKQGEDIKYTAVTNEQGIAEFTNVIYGDYELVEIATLPNYVLSEETREVSIKEDGLVVDLGDFANDPIIGSIILKKVDGNSKEPLEGVMFALIKDGKEVARETSDKLGIVRFERVAYGDYTVVEVTALKGYILSEETYKARINKLHQILDLGQITNFKEETKEVLLPKTGSMDDMLIVWGNIMLVILLFFYFGRKQIV